MTRTAIEEPNLSVRKFYFLEYFYILLESVSRYKNREQVFDSFKLLKQQYGLGESKFKKLMADPENLTETQLSRYRYTFNQVIEEAKGYRLVAEDDDKTLRLKGFGKDLLEKYGTDSYNHELLKLMEEKSGAFRHLIRQMYKANPANPGLLIFPVYSPYQLDFSRADTKTTGDIRRYGDTLAARLERDADSYLGKRVELREKNSELISRLIDSELLPRHNSEPFLPEKYNAIVTRFRAHWLNYFLKDIYEYDLSLSAFDIWTYRGKQIGIIHATEFYPNFHGRLVFPTSVIESEAGSPDFQELYRYSDDGSRLYVHRPLDEEGQDSFVDFLWKGYLSLRRTHRSYFINLSALRELVCYNMRISERVFESLLDLVYKHRLSGNLRIRISLEVDRLPEETNALYLKQAPVMVDGKYRNIIAIDLLEGVSRHE